MSVINATPLLAAAGGDYEISRSVRLRSSASAYFNRTFGTPTNGDRFTWSGWVKRGAIGSVQPLFLPSLASGEGAAFTAAGNLNISVNGAWLLVSSAVYRDPSAWYHIMLVSDMGNATASLRFRVYVNGSEVTAWSTDARASYTSFPYWNKNTVVHYMGYSNAYPAYADGYMTEVNFIDGQALTPSSFGETDSITGVWKPKKYAGTYGTNGFYLNFSDPSAATAAAIGKDSSGNGNNWTPNNISVTSGVTYDSMLDVPTMYADGGNGRGNYAVLNPLYNTGTLGYLPTRNANLTVYDSSGDANWRSRWATIGMTSGKWYAEFPITYSGSASVSSAGAIAIGLHDGGSASYVGKTSTTYGYFANATRHNNSSPVSYGATYANGDIIGVAYDADAGTLTFYKNGTSQGVAYSSIPVGTYFFAVSAFWVSPDGNTTINANFGQRPFAYTPPTGFKALNTQNLPESTIKKGNAYFDVLTWTGDNSSTGAVKTRTGLQFQPDFVWIKNRGAAWWHSLFDSVRGVGSTKNLASNTTNAEGDSASLYGYVSAFTADGFQTTNGSDATNAGIWTNQNGNTFASWAWKKSASAGFDIVTYTGTGANRTVAHSLGVAPSMIILKQRNAVDFWVAWHSALANTEYLLLNSTNAKATAATYWNSTSPTSSVFSLGTDSRPNGSGTTYVAYLFAEVAGYSKFGSYTGNGSTDGPFVYLGFRPRWLLLKISSTTGSWTLVDTSRNTYNLTTQGLYADLSNAEDSSRTIDILSNGFKLRGVPNNQSGETFIYAAFAENPFKNSLAR